MKVVNRFLQAGGGNNRPKMLVVHSMAEFIRRGDDVVSAYDLLVELGLSAHALVCPDGTVIKSRPEMLVAWHAKGFNQDSLGVEFLVDGTYDYGEWVARIRTPWLTREQWLSGLELVSDWMCRYKGSELVRHSDIDPKRKVDPGDGFPWSTFFDEAKRRALECG